MAAKGTYSEKLPCGGTLEVTTNGFRIQYYFPGPDARHSGTFVNLEDYRLKDYIAAYKENWNEYLKLKATIPKGGEFQQADKLGMQIRIGAFHEGICLQSYHKPVNTEAGLQRVLESYNYAITRADQVRGMLQTL